MIGKAIKWMLIGYGNDGYNPQYDIYNLVGSDVFPNIIPQTSLTNNIKYPVISYSVEKNNPDKIKELRSPNNRVSIEINIMDKSYAVVNQLSTIVINQLHRYTNSFNSNDSDGIGYGTNGGSNAFGKFAPASTGEVQYVGGLQIQYLGFDNSIESYDEKLQVFRNTLNFNMVYIDDLSTWGADILLKFTDLNLMATNIGATEDPLYSQPISLNQGVNYLFTPSVLVSDNSNIESDTLDGIYENFYDSSGTSNTNRPTIKKDTLSPPKFNGNNYLEFASSKYLLSSKATDRVARKYKEFTFFGVMDLPNSNSGSDTRHTASVLFKRNSTSTEMGCIFFDVNIVGDPSVLGMRQFAMGGIALQDDGAGADKERGFNFRAAITSWPAYDFNPNVNMESPFFFSVSMKIDPDDSTNLIGESEWISSSDFALLGDKDVYESWNDTTSDGNNFKEYMFNFETLHSDISSYDTNGAGTLDMNYPINIYDFVMWPEAITFGSNKYNEIKRQIIEKHNMYQRITD